jgi:hypothetical protein
MLNSCGKKGAINVSIPIRYDINIEDSHNCRRRLRISEAHTLLEDLDRAEEICSRWSSQTFCACGPSERTQTELYLTFPFYRV